MATRTPLMRGIGSSTDLVRDESDPDGMHYFDKRYHDAHALRQNQRIRSSKLVQQGRMIGKRGLMENAPIVAAFSIPHARYFELATTEPEIWAMMQSSNPDEQIRAYEKLAILYPQWKVSV